MGYGTTKIDDISWLAYYVVLVVPRSRPNLPDHKYNNKFSCMLACNLKTILEKLMPTLHRHPGYKYIIQVARF